MSFFSPILRRFLPRMLNYSFYSTNFLQLEEVFKKIDKDPDRLSAAAKLVIKEYTTSNDQDKNEILFKLAQNCGVRHEALANAINLYTKNPSTVHEVQFASCPIHFHLLRSVGNQPNGIKLVCLMRENLLIAEYEAVHPVRGLADLRTRIGPHRRCFYFTHEAMPREPLVMVHVALMNKIGDSVQEITAGHSDASKEEDHTSAIYYSITSTQKAGIDLGNLLIKQVASKISRDVPSITIHSTLSPIPGFRAWLIRSLKGHSEYGDILTNKVLKEMAIVTGRATNTEEATSLLLNAFSNTKITHEQLEPLKNILLHLCAKYLYKAKRNGFALNPVANFHLRNGAELHRLNWNGDVSHRGINNSLGIMVNYSFMMSFNAETWSNYECEEDDRWEKVMQSVPPPPRRPPPPTPYDRELYPFCEDYPGLECYSTSLNYVHPKIPHFPATYGNYPLPKNYHPARDNPPPMNYPPMAGYSQTNHCFLPRTFPRKRPSSPNHRDIEYRPQPAISPIEQQFDYLAHSPSAIDKISIEEREKRLKKILPQEGEKFEDYLETLTTEEQKFVKTVVERVVSGSHSIILPDSDLLSTMIPFPTQIASTSGIFPSTSTFSFDPASSRMSDLLKESFSNVSDMKLPPLPPKSLLEEVNMHSKTKRSIEEILSALKTEACDGHRFFGYYIGEEIKKIDPEKREVVALKILDLMKDLEHGEPTRKRPKLEATPTDSKE